ncbi:unnamed protein product [Lampetra fluviatilis]
MVFHLPSKLSCTYDGTSDIVPDDAWRHPRTHPPRQRGGGGGTGEATWDKTRQRGNASGRTGRGDSSGNGGKGHIPLIHPVDRRFDASPARVGFK